VRNHLLLQATGRAEGASWHHGNHCILIMIHTGQFSANMSSPAVQVAVLVAGCLMLYVAFKIGFFILKMALGLVALALPGGATWWFLSGINH
jgi:hypothetical protein